ncbi:MAG: GH92 family glycosyl hydrolase, partial [Rikenellaceae bacterium]|nr:GH92 family glycosyl hydrolase [Rikenellaceae bacterium]
MKRLLLFASLAVAACCREGSETDYVRYVDPYIGTGGHGHVFMGASVPFGMVQLGPTSIPQSWDWTSGYHISDTTVIGFAHTHLSGTGIGDLGDIVLTPVAGEVALGRGVEEDPASGQWSYFRRANERCAPGYYATRLERYWIDVELTATERVGLHRYTFPATDDARVVIDLADGQCWDGPVNSCIVQTSDTTLTGYRFSKGWARDQRVWFTAHFSKPIKRLLLSEGNGARESATSLRGVRVFGQACFGDVGSVMIKVALSPVSVENAEANMLAEASGWDFEAAVAAARTKWNAELGKIAIETDDPAVKKIFYTGLYHTMIAPSLYCDANGDYRGADSEAHRDGGFVNYTTLSLWDTYRAAHPLMTIIHPERVPDMINAMLHIYKQQGKLPVWHLMGCETDCMVGNPAICVVADALLKGFGGFDRELACEAMSRSAMLDERGLGLLKKYGYIPSDLYNESVATCMEYAIADWALAQAAQRMGRQDDHKYFLDRSRSYRRYFDPSTGFMRGRLSDGSLRAP